MKENVIYSTTDYNQFTKVDGNRVENKLHLAKLEKAIVNGHKKEDIKNIKLPPILVNEKKEVIDGQHRLHIAKKFGIPVYFYMSPDADLSTVHAMNTNVKNWSADDFMDSYIRKGVKEYQTYKEFMQSYKLPHSVTLSLLMGVASRNGDLYTTFKNGKLKIKDIEGAAVKASFINNTSKYYDGYRRRSFVSAIIRCLNNKKFSPEEFIHKLSYQQAKMVHCATSEQYLSVIESIYNYKRAEKINLRF